MRHLFASIEHRSTHTSGDTFNRTASALTEYTLLLAVISCSILFGARLIMSCKPTQFRNLDGHGVDRVENSSAAHAPSPSEVPAELTGDSQSERGFLTTQIASMAVLLMLGITASVALLKTRKSLTAISGPELGSALLGPTGPDRFAVKRQEIYRVLCCNLKQVLTSNVNIGHIVSIMPLTVTRNEPVVKMAETMKDNQIRHLLVCDDDQKLLGVVSDRDVSTARGATAGDIMSPHPCTVTIDTDLRTAVTILLKYRFSALPILEGERLIGIVTVTDLIIVLQVALQLLDKFNAQITHGTLLDPEGHAEECLVEAAT